MLDIWRVAPSGMQFSKRVMRLFGGFTGTARVKGDDYFASDWSGRPNYLLRLRQKKKFFFPQPAFTRFVWRMKAFDSRYILCVHKCLLEEDKAWVTLFDCETETFSAVRELASVLGVRGFQV